MRDLEARWGAGGVRAARSGASCWTLALALACGSLACSDNGASSDDAALDGSALPDSAVGGAPDGSSGDAPVVACTVDPCVGSEGEALCGPVLDLCSGETVFCEPCEGDQVCNLRTSACEVPRTTCEDLGAECGRVVNSCGGRVECPQCPTGQRCDLELKECVECGEITCDDLGIQCGKAWLGCGPSDELTDCGPCPKGFVCNEDPRTNVGYHTCEPEDCTPPRTPEEIEQHCFSQGRSRGLPQGAVCGFVTDGCGDIVACGDAGKCEDKGRSCGALGVPNRCDLPPRPDECLAENRECGSLTSKCSGLVLACGNCTGDDEKCVEDTGRCCVPKKCGEGDLEGKCGRALDDGCGDTIDCLSCLDNQVCSPGEDGVVRDCIDQGECADVTTGEEEAVCGYFDRGDGKEVPCFCQDESNTLFCVKDAASVVKGEQGTCCKDENACAASPKDGPCQRDNSCITGRKVNCCTGGLFCDTPSLTCQDCAGAGFSPTVNGKCSRGCPCNNNQDLTCVKTDRTRLITGSEVGICLKLLDCPASALGDKNDTCSTRANKAYPRWAGDPTGRSCACKNDFYCVVGDHIAKAGELGRCADKLPCKLPWKGNLDSICSRGASPTFPRFIHNNVKDATGQKCDCKSSFRCVKNGALVTGSNTGTCIPFKSCSIYTNGEGGATCSNGVSPTFERWKDDTAGQKCVCDSGLVCVASGVLVTGQDRGSCTPRLPCPENANGDVDDECSTQVSSKYKRWLGDLIGQACPCDPGVICNNGGTCCKPQCGDAECDSVTDSCGTINCGTCTGPYDVCSAENKCECVSEPKEEVCRGTTEIVVDRCGKNVQCGSG